MESLILWFSSVVSNNWLVIAAAIFIIAILLALFSPFVMFFLKSICPNEEEESLKMEALCDFDD